MLRLHSPPIGILAIAICLSASCGGFLPLGSGLLAAQGTNAQTPVEAAKSLLTTYWSSSLENRQQGEAAYRSAAKSGGVDWRVHDAFAWNRMNQNRYRDALETLEQLTAGEHVRIEHWMALSWVQVVVKDYDRGLMTLRRIKAAFDSLPAGDLHRTAALIHMGKLIGFAEGPIRDQVNPEVVRVALAAAEQGLDDRELEILRGAMTEVRDRHDQIIADRTQARGEFMEDARKKAEAEATQLEQQNQTMEQRLSQLQPAARQLTEDHNTQLSNLRAQASPLQSQLGILQSQLTNLNFDLQQIYAETAFQQNQLANTEDPRLQFFIRNRLTQLFYFARDVEAQILNTNSQIRNVDGQLRTLLAEQRRLSVAYDQQMGQLNQEQRQLQNQISRNQKRVLKLGEDPKRVTGEALKLANQIDLLTTYYELPVEQYRQDAIDRLQPVQ